MKKENNLENTTKQKTNTKNETTAPAKLEKKIKTKETKLKTAKVKKPKTVKPLKQKTQKAIKIKAEKPKKVKKAKTKKTLKQKLTLGLSIFFCIALSFFGVGIVFTSNDFAMTLVFSQNTEKALLVTNVAREDIFLSPNIDMLVTVEVKYLETGEISSRVVLDMKTAHYVNTNTYNYSAKVNLSYMPNAKVDLNYVNGVFYQKIVEGSNVLYKTKTNVATAQQTFSMFMPVDPNMLQFILPTSANPILNTNSMINQKTGFILPTSPLYIGQKIRTSYENNITETFKLNYKGDPKEYNYNVILGNSQFNVNIKYNSINKFFQLPLPTDLNTY